MNKDKAFLNFITYAPIFLIPFFVSIIILLTYQVYSQSFHLSITNLEQDILNKEKKNLKTKIDNLSKLIIYKKSEINKKLKKRVKNHVQIAYDIAHSIYNEYKGTKSEREIKGIIKTTLRTFTWNNSESYIWISDFDGVHYLLCEADKHLEGTSLKHIKDAQGRYVIKEEISIAKEKGQGYLWNTYTKPNSNDMKQYKQVAFVKAFGHYNWYFGTTEFLDTATKKMDKKLFKMINELDTLDNNYVYIIDLKGNILVHKFLPQFVGNNITITDKLVIDTLNNALSSIRGKDNSEYIYTWYNVKTKKKEKKYSYLKRIPETDWFIGSGFIISEIEKKFLKQKISMYKIYDDNSKYILYITILIILISLFISLLVSKKVKKNFFAYRTHISEKKQELELLNATLEEKVKNRTIELEIARDKLKVLATTDSLTNIQNRYSIMKTFEYEINRSNRYKYTLSVIMYDIDFFKKVNDTYGHAIGDKVLILLSNLVSNSLRDSDIFGRYGGEEFLIIMPNTTLDESIVYAERLRKEVEEYIFDEVGKVTISIGVTEVENNENIDQTFQRLDNLLYSSKDDGRNKVSY